MECKGCGRQITDESVFCQYCGYSITGQARPAQQQAQAKSGMSAGTIVAIVIVAVVVIPVVLAAVLYVMVLGFGSDDARYTTPLAAYSKAIVTNGFEITIVTITGPDVAWTDVTVLLRDETDFAIAEWKPSTADLDGGDAVSSNLTTDSMGSLTVCCVVYDDRGDGYVSSGDYFRLYTYNGAAAFDSETTYRAVLIYEPTGEMMGTGQPFTG